jgi:hypothetical protein
MRKAPQFYVTTQDEHGKGHHYRQTANEMVPFGEEITGLRPAGQFRFSSVLSPESLDLLKAVKPSRNR